MPYVIVSTVALLSNLYKNAPLIVGDKDSDPDLMRFLGARITTNYPACGSPPMYVMHAPPRTVFDNLEKRGYCLLCSQTIQEHSVWILARPRVPDDDKVEISRGGPNDKSIQAFEENESTSPLSSPSNKRPSFRSKSPTRNQKATKDGTEDSLQIKSSENRKDTVNVTSKGDGNLDWLLSEKVHMRIQVSNSDVSVQNSPEVSTKSTGVLERSNSSISKIKHSASLVKGIGLPSPPVESHDESNETANTESKYFAVISRCTQANISAGTLVFSDGWDTTCKNRSGISLYYTLDGSKKKFDNKKPLMLDSFTQNQSEIMGQTSESSPQNSPVIQPNVTCPETVIVRNFTPPSSQILQNRNDSCIVMNETILASTHGSKCSPSVTLLENPVFALTDSRHLACLTQGNCCCEEE